MAEKNGGSFLPPSEPKVVAMRSSLLPPFSPQLIVHQGQLTLPKTPMDAYKASREVSHKALEMVGKSLCAQRPANRAVLFLYGVSGAGKSSTLNHLFNGAESIPISHNKSGLRDVVEYAGSMVSEHWSANGLEISFVDAPGFNDTRGKVQDAYNLANIEKFISNHPQLGLHNFAKFAGIFYTYSVFYPNIILITVDANDERMFGYDTEVGRMLRAIGKKKMRLVDKKRPNVVFVLTHVCGIPRGNWPTKLKSKAYCLQLLGRRYLKIHAPVVYIENDHEVWGLEKEGEWTVLHNRERQPENLFNKCIEVMQRNQDEVGIEAMRLYFENSRLIPLENVYGVKGKLMVESDEDVLDENVQYWLSKIKSPFKILDSTSVDVRINQHIAENNEDDLELELYPLKFILQKNNLHETDNISSRTLPELECLLLPYKLSTLEKHVLCQLFNPKQPKLQQISPILGCGYNILEDKVLAPVFDTTHIERLPHYNFLVPTGANVYEYPKTEAVCCGVPNMSAYAEEKLKLFDSTGFVHLANKLPLSCGYNIIDPSLVPKKKCSVSFLVEQTVFRIQLTSNSYPLCKMFLADVGTLPVSFDTSEDDNIQAFSEFFKKYGFWAIVQLSLGGYIKGDIKTSRTNALDKEYYSSVRKWVITHIGNTMNGAKFTETAADEDWGGNELQVYQELLPSALQWFGGDQRFYQSCLKMITMKSWNTWTESLKMNPTVLDGRHIPLPIHSILQSHDHSKAHVVQEAYCYFTGKGTVLHKPLFKRLLGMSYTLPSPKSRQEASDQVKTEIREDSCFPPHVTVRLDSGRIVSMKDINIGDRVLSVNSEGRACFSPVYLWGHLDPDTETEYLRISHTQGEIRVSDNHLVFVVRRENGDVGPIPASRVRVGDLLQYVCVDVVESAEVLTVSRVKEVGVYSPFTLTSRIVVDGVVCSVFAVPPGKAQEVNNVHRIGHILFAPIRFCYKTGLCPPLSYQMDASKRMHLFCSTLQKGYSTFRPIENIVFSRQTDVTFPISQ